MLAGRVSFVALPYSNTDSDSVGDKLVRVGALAAKSACVGNCDSTVGTHPTVPFRSAIGAGRPPLPLDRKNETTGADAHCTAPFKMPLLKITSDVMRAPPVLAKPP